LGWGNTVRLYENRGGSAEFAGGEQTIVKQEVQVLVLTARLLVGDKKIERQSNGRPRTRGISERSCGEFIVAVMRGL